MTSAADGKSRKPSGSHTKTDPANPRDQIAGQSLKLKRGKQ